MKWLPIAASLVFLCAAVSALASPTPRYKKHSKAKTDTHAHAARAPHAKHMAQSTHKQLRAPREEERQASFRQVSQTTSSTAKAKKKKTVRRGKTRRHGPTQMAPTAERISEIQSALGRGGYYKADPNGQWDADTVDALQKFQSANGLDVTGKLDALTLQKLGLGSGIAGVSAPRGIVEHSCCSMTPSSSMAPPPGASQVNGLDPNVAAKESVAAESSASATGISSPTTTPAKSSSTAAGGPSPSGTRTQPAKSSVSTTSTTSTASTTSSSIASTSRTASSAGRPSGSSAGAGSGSGSSSASGSSSSSGSNSPSTQH